MELSIIESLLARSPDAAIVVDSFGHVSSWNAASNRLFAYRQEEILGKHVDLLLLPSEGLSFGTHLRSIAGGSIPDLLELRCVSKTGSLIPVQISMTPVYGTGTKTGLSGKPILNFTHKRSPAHSEKMMSWC